MELKEGCLMALEDVLASENMTQVIPEYSKYLRVECTTLQFTIKRGRRLGKTSFPPQEFKD